MRKIVGPGSPAVTLAQVEMQRYGVTTMMLLGPTESVVLADDTADPERLAADLLIEAEHGTDTSVVLVTTSADLADRTDAELDPAARLRCPSGGPRRPAPRSAPNGGCVLVDTLDEAVAIVNRYAPEHLQVAVADDRVDRRRRRHHQRRRDPDRPAHAVQRRQLRDRLPRLAAHERLRPRQFGHHRRHVPQAHRRRPRRRRRARDGSARRSSPSPITRAFPAHAAAIRDARPTREV